MKQILNDSRSLLALSLALVFMTAFLMPVTVNASVQDDPYEVSVVVLYDESFAAFAENETGTDPEERLDQIMRWAGRSFKETFDIELDYDIMSYEDAIGIPYSQTANSITGCDDLWTWQTVLPSPNRDLIREWNHYYGQCHCIMKNSNCYVNDQTPGHHNSGKRILHDMFNATSLNNQYDIMVCFVGYYVCYYRSSAQTHKRYGGLTQSGGMNVTVVSSITELSEFGFTYEPLNFLHCVGRLQHELSHDFGAHDGYCTANYPCIMSGGFTGIVYSNNIWCPQCGGVDFNPAKFEPSGGA